MSDEAKVVEAYKTLGLRYGASEFEIKQAFRTFSKELHSDINGGDPGKTDRFKSISAAYSLLDKLRKLGRLPTGPGNEDEAQESSATSGASDERVKTNPPFVVFEVFKGLLHVRPPSVTVRITQAAGEVKRRPQIQKTAGDFWRAMLVEPGSDDRRYGVLFTCTVTAMPVGNYTDTMTLLVGDEVLEVPIELVVLPLAYMNTDGSQASTPTDEAETEEWDEEEYSNERYRWLMVCIASLIGPFGLAAIALPRDGVYNFGTGLIGLLCAAWFVGGLISIKPTLQAFRE